MNYDIRIACVSDANVLDNLFTSLIKCDQKYDLNIKDELIIQDYFKERIKEENSIILVCCNANKIIGYIFGYVQTDNKMKKDLEACIESLFVIDEYRNQGIGKSLINRFIEEAKIRDVKYVFIENKVDNKVAKFLYDKLNFNVFIQNRRREI